jgi:biopolymer transport protein TolQ
VNIDSSFLTYFWNAGIVVKFVMILLVSASVLSWTFILQRFFYVKDIRDATTRFEEAFWSGGDMGKLYNDISRRRLGSLGIDAIFHAGFKEFLRLQNKVGVSAEAVIESVKRAMRGAQMREQDKLELQLPFLATVGSISPYVGLFGTVWGIMLAFRGLAHVQQATISAVAPGIAEALIATALGLFAAIPAVIAYNRFNTDIGRLLNRFDVFQDEFENILFRQSKQNISEPQSIMTAEME